MSLISFSNIQDGSTIDAADVNSPMNTIYNDYNGGIDSNNLADNAVTATKLANDNVTDAKLVYGKVRTRQGGSATNWATTGTTTYDYSTTNTFIQCGSIAITGTGLVDFTVTFPTAFNQTPCVVVSPRGSGGTTTTWYLYGESATVFHIVIASGAVMPSLSWVAIGQ